MPTTYPGAIDSFTRPAAGSSFTGGGATDGTVVVDNLMDAVEALEAMVGVEGSAVTTTHEYQINNSIMTGTVTQAGVTSPAAFAANQNNYATPANICVIRASGTAARDITGQTGTAGLVIRWMNIGATFNLTLKNESASSTAANRFAFGADVILGPNEGATIWYDTTSSRWRLVGMAGGTEFLRKTGGTVTGDVLAPTPANPTSIATKSYVDTTAAAAVSTALAKSIAFVQYSAGWPARTTATSDATRMVVWKGPAVAGAGPTIGGAGNAVNGVDVWWEEA